LYRRTHYLLRSNEMNCSEMIESKCYIRQRADASGYDALDFERDQKLFVK